MEVAMWALAALICFILGLFKVTLGDLDIVVLGFCFVALHLLWAIPFPTFVRRS